MTYIIERVAQLRRHLDHLQALRSRVPHAAARLAELQGGRVVVGIAGIPYKCPPAPYKAVMLLVDLFRRHVSGTAWSCAS
jgi:hypothetical protein